MRTIHNILFICCCLVLSSCDTHKDTLKKAIHEYNTAPICCETVEEFEYIPLGHNEVKAFSIDETSGAYEFGTVKSFFMAFELPQYTNPYTINVRSMRMGPWLRVSHIFLPEVVFLNNKYQVTRTIESETFATGRVTVYEKPARDVFLEANISIDDNNKADKYMVIYTDPHPGKEKTAIRAQGAKKVWLPIRGEVPARGAEDVEIPYAPVGQLRIRLQDKL